MVHNTYFIEKSISEAETSRLDWQNQFWLCVQKGKYHLAPFSVGSPPRSVLDIGCGSGVWTEGVARIYPDAHIVGIDLTPPPPSPLSNVRFLEANALRDWSFATSSNYAPYDFITARVLVAGIRDWPALFVKCYQHLQPGGWLEVPDSAGFIYADNWDMEDLSTPIMRFFAMVWKTFEAGGIDRAAASKRVHELQDAGFVDVSEQRFTVYISEDSVLDNDRKQQARLSQPAVLGVVDGLASNMLERGEWKMLGVGGPEELTEVREAAKKDLMENAVERGYHTIWTIHLGRKPLAD